MTQRTRSSLFNLPNQLTMARLVLSAVCFVVLALAGHEAIAQASRPLVLNLSTLLFVLAVCTDFVDGYLARKWRLESTFGRIADPFVDKITICGAFILLTGISPLVRPWYALLIVFREFLISGLRSYLESGGVAFGAALSGKLKMIFQSVAIPAVLLHEANFAHLRDSAGTSVWAAIAAPFEVLTIGLLVLTLILTFSSCVGYIQRAIELLRD